MTLNMPFSVAVKGFLFLNWPLFDTISQPPHYIDICSVSRSPTK